MKNDLKAEYSAINTMRGPKYLSDVTEREKK